MFKCFTGAVAGIVLPKLQKSEEESGMKAEEPESQVDPPSPVLEDAEAAGSSDSKETADTRTSISSLCFYYLKNMANCLRDKASLSYVNQKYFICR